MDERHGTVTITMELLDEHDVDGTCGDCGFDALREFVVAFVNTCGVLNVTAPRVCVRCQAEKNRSH